MYVACNAPQVHHIDNFALMASWANGMLAAAAYKAPGAAPSDTGTITASGVRCLLCEDSAETGAEPRPADKVLLGPHIVGAAHMLQHLAEVHPRRLVQVAHCLHLLTGTYGGMLLNGHEGDESNAAGPWGNDLQCVLRRCWG